MIRSIFAIIIMAIMITTYVHMVKKSHEIKLENSRIYDETLKNPLNIKKEKVKKEVDKVKQQIRGDVTTTEQQSIYYMAKTLYYEAQITSYDDRAAIAQVIMNRTKDKRFPKTVKGVVLQDKQFSCFNTPHNLPDLNSKVWKECIKISKLAVRGKLKRTVGHAVFYHTPEVNPKWNRNMVRVKTIFHIFYVG